MNEVHTGSLVLEPQVAAHAAEMFDVLSDPAIYELENAPPESRAALERRFALLESRVSPDGREQWLNWVVRLPEGALAGYVQATIARDGIARIAYVLASRFWGRGIGQAAVGAMLEELGAAYGVRICAATLKARNTRSLALLRRLGFAEERPDGRPPLEHAPDEVVMYQALGRSNDISADDEELVHFAPEAQFRDAVERLFRLVEARLRSAVPNADIQHVGSTAIPGSLTKGDLDIQVRVHATDYAAAKEALGRLFSLNLGGFASDDATSFEDYSTEPSLGVHLTVIGGAGDIQCKFRDALRASADLRREYDRLKQRFQGGSMEKYRGAKAEFVSRVLGYHGIVED